MHRILIADSLGAAGIELLRREGAHVDLLSDDDRPRLNELIADYDALIVRSATKVTRELLEAGEKLKVVGRAGVGIDNIDLKAATARGVLVVNSPTANLLSATEQTFALLLALVRHIPHADADMKKGEWNRKKWIGQELQGKTLGIIGFGRIGQRVAERARGFAMECVAADPFLSDDVAKQHEVEAVQLDDLLERSDMITFHTPLTDETRGMLSAERIAKMKDGALVINCGRGGVLDEPALLEAIESGKIAGAGIDVWSQEPPEDWSLAHHPRVVATPHLGASTQEAQERVATDTARSILAALAGSLAVPAVNLPFRAAGSRGEPYLRLAEQLGRLTSSVLGSDLKRIAVEVWGVEESLRHPVTVAATKGALVPALGSVVNYVNAEGLAADRGIEVVRSVHAGPSDYSHLISVRVEGGAGQIEAAGTLYGEGDSRIVGFQGFRLEFRPAGRLMVVRNLDVPGVVGRLGTLIGDAGINIADIHLSRQGHHDALAVLRLDQVPPRDLIAAIQGLDEVKRVDLIDLD